MPPKSKSGRKRKGAKPVGKGPSTHGGTTHKENLSELNKEYYHLQIKDLENRLGRLVLKEPSLTDLEQSASQIIQVISPELDLSRF